MGYCNIYLTKREIVGLNVTLQTQFYRKIIFCEM